MPAVKIVSRVVARMIANESVNSKPTDQLITPARRAGSSGDLTAWPPRLTDAPSEPRPARKGRGSQPAAAIPIGPVRSLHTEIGTNQHIPADPKLSEHSLPSPRSPQPNHKATTETDLAGSRLPRSSGVCPQRTRVLPGEGSTIGIFRVTAAIDTFDLTQTYGRRGDRPSST